MASFGFCYCGDMEFHHHVRLHPDFKVFSHVCESHSSMCNIQNSPSLRLINSCLEINFTIHHRVCSVANSMKLKRKSKKTHRAWIQVRRISDKSTGMLRPAHFFFFFWVTNFFSVTSILFLILWVLVAVRCGCKVESLWLELKELKVGWRLKKWTECKLNMESGD